MPDQKQPQLGINSWLEDELYATYLNDKKNVDESWKSVFETNGHGKTAGTPGIPTSSPNGHGTAARDSASAPAVPPGPSDEVVVLRGVAGKIAENMTASLTVPTATSQRVIPVRALEQARTFVNDHRAAAGQPKLSYTHFISWAIVKALSDFPGLNDAFAQQNGEPCRIVRRQVNFGLAVDVKGKDGQSSLMVPNIKNAGGLSFTEFLAAFDDVVIRARNGKLQMPDFQGTTVSLTNPGTVGTTGSVPRLMVGQGAIIATGAMDYPPEYSTVPAETKAQLGLSKVMMVTCTYDHRIIQGADSGRFLARLQSLLAGEDGFYDQINIDLGLSKEAGSAAVAPARAVETAPTRTAAESALTTADAMKEAAVGFLVEAYRVHGHLIADLNPLGSRRVAQPDLDPATYGLTEADLDRPCVSQGGRTVRQIVDSLRRTYCDKAGTEYMYIQDPEARLWIRNRLESTELRWPLEKEDRLRILDDLIDAEEFEHFLHTRFIGKKRFSVEGGESSIAALDQIVERAAHDAVQNIVMGMAHRGRLTILANIVGKPLNQVFAEFEESPDATLNTYGSGDVKYHLGAKGTRKGPNGTETGIYVAFNPSHLEAVDSVVEGMVRPQQDRAGDRSKIIPILIHGDSAFAGQGVVQETLNLSRLEGYTTGGTIHVVINNQLGFTTEPNDTRSGSYSTDIARAVQAPVFHVNGDAPEAAFRVAQIAYEFRQRFHQDVVIDVVCFRKWGHNEGDDPSYTQPLMYKTIKGHPSVVKQYADRLVADKVLTPADVDARRKAYVNRLSEGFELAKRKADEYELQEVHPAPLDPSDAGTAISRATAEHVINTITRLPDNFHLHPKLKTVLDRRKEVLSGGPIDWATGEALALGSLCLESFTVRLSGQDSGRGTFSHRHAELHDYENGQIYKPLQHLEPTQGRFEIWNSPLSEYAVMGFEFGYSVCDANALVMWEAQFGDFVNGAQIIIDQFLTCAEYKWGTASGLVLLLPHGYEGMGPEHSSGRIERFLQLCAENNMQVANCTTPAQYFHLLRRQMHGSPEGKPVRKPLIVFTPKSLLRDPRATSKLDEVTGGQFSEVIPDVGKAPASGITRLLFCSGKVYYDLADAREKRGAKHVAIARIEQLYPFPGEAIRAVLDQYPTAKEVYWVQEEPRNQGAWRFLRGQIQKLLDPSKRAIRYAGRAESASPAGGMAKRHDEEQHQLVDDAFAPQPVVRRPRRVKSVKKNSK
jgi:2-oxoglutarate decarboxylase